MSESNLPDPKQDIFAYNEQAWNSQVKQKNQWTIPVSPDDIENARNGEWSIVLTPQKPVPKEWFPDFGSGEIEVLCLASGGGQQGPILAAAGANVTVFDLSESQLKQDEMVAEREGLKIKTVKGSMLDLSAFEDESFDLIFHPCSNSFVPDVNPVWKEAARVLKKGGSLLSGFIQPIFFLFDYEKMEKGEFVVTNSIPYSDITSIDDEHRKLYTDNEEPLCFGHTLEDQINGQIEAGLAITGFYEDVWPGNVISDFVPSMAATRATKL